MAGGGWPTRMVAVGLDEAGVGACFGSLWAAAVHLPVGVPGLGDSKTLSEKKRERLRSDILSVAAYGLGEVTHTEIDALGLGEARRLVFERALDDYVARNAAPPTQLIVDGTIFRPWGDVPFTLLPKADATVPSVSAASILAKTTRDRQVVEQADGNTYSVYGIKSNKGYLSRAHIEAIRMHGRSPLHRHSYVIRELAPCVMK